jgi:hypothetical protein
VLFQPREGANRLKIEAVDLTTCRLDESGKFAEIGFISSAGVPISLRCSLDRAQSIATTLSELLPSGLWNMGSEQQAREALTLVGWRIEDTLENGGVIITLSANDGSDVSFDIPLEACSGLGSALKNEVDRRTDSSASDEPR